MFTAIALAVISQNWSPADLVQSLQWRCIGPFRGGRTVGACGVPSQPNTFFIGVNNGGVWKTTDAGRTWVPIFDDQPTGSIGDLAVSPSNPNIIYVGSGEGLQRPDLSTGDGIYRSSDGGKTWKHLGLKDAQQIGGIALDPKNPDRLFVAALGHPYGANKERGVFRTLDGGKTWKHVLDKGEDVGAIQVEIDPKNPKVIYADMWEARQGPWENGAWQGPGSGLFKSTDGGDNWRRLERGLPTVAEGLGRIGFCIAPSNPKTLYATVDAGTKGGLYKSRDAGESWTRVNSEARLISRGSDFADVRVDPKNSEIVYVSDTSFYKSTNGGKDFTCLKGSPGGDDYHRLWINPHNPEILLLAADQGAAVSVNGGDTWSSWYNQPTAQFYHITTDNQFPYSVYGGQQESGSAGVSSRGNDGQITFREWHPVGGDEYGYSAPDPLNPRYVFGGRINRYDKVTGEIQSIRPKGAFRTLRTAPVLFSTVDKKALYFAGNILFRTRDGGSSWETLSPDLSRETTEVPKSIGKFRTPEMKSMARRGVIYTVAPSHVSADTIWCGTDDGLIWRSADSGKNWQNVTPPGLDSWSKVSLMDAGYANDLTAYAAVNRIRLDDQKPHIYRTHNGGKSWQEIVKGLPPAPVNVVRADPLRPGLIFCGTETAAYFSQDDGDNWYPIRQNMPATSIRDLVVHENDLVVGTHGRSIWILDGMSLLRETTWTPNQFTLFKPASAILIDRNTNSDTPLPPEEPAGKNPPDGALVDYWLPKDAKLVELSIHDATGKLIRKYRSDDPITPLDPKAITVLPGWAKPPTKLSNKRGAQRLVWDLRGPRPSNGNGLPISAIWGETPLHPLGPVVTAGTYTVSLSVDGSTISQTVEVSNDPRKPR